MGFLGKAIDFILHIDKYLALIIQNYGTLTYLFLFLIIFIETGLVIAPFLPGDSLLFVAGTFAAQKALNLYFLIFLLIAAAILGDTLNYWIGSYFGEHVFAKSRLFNKEHLEKTKKFYEKHGGKTIIFARFIPIIRSFAPFVAGVSRMKYSRFLMFNVIGGISWVTIFILGGYFFGGIKFVQENLTYFIIGIIVVSFMPPVVELIRSKQKKK